MKKEMNNKGFSLVELIIVIAIMAVLVAFAAPQYLKYVNNSRVATDVTNAQAIATAFNVAYADGDVAVGVYNSSAAVPADVELVGWPNPRHTETDTWEVTLTVDGVTLIELGGLEIYPEPEATGNYMDTREE